MPHKMRERLEHRVPVRGQHFAVGVDIDARALRLLQQFVQVFEIMTGNEDGLALAVPEGNLRGDGIAERLGVPGVQKLHRLQVGLAAAQDKIQPIFKAARLVRRAVLVGHPGGERLVDEGVQLRVSLAKDRRVICIGGYALQPVQEQLHGGTDIHVVAETVGPGLHLPNAFPVGIHSRVTGIRRTAELRSERLAAAYGFPRHFFKGRGIEIHVGKGGEQRADGKVVRILLDHALGAGLERRAGQQPQRIDHMVLKIGHRSQLAANAHNRAARALRRLFTLIAKHGNLQS